MPVVLDPPAAPTGYSAAELARAAGIAPRTVRHYVAVGLLAKPEFRARRTTYGREHLVRLLAIQKLRAQKLGIGEIKRRLAKASVEELAKQVLPEVKPAAPAASEVTGAELPGARWSRVDLLPGLELHVRGDASAFVRRIAAEIHARYASAPVSEGEG